MLNQTYRDFEVIILDDCSTDNSVEIIREYLSSDKISQMVVNEKNSGSTFLQWEKGLSLARGKYIWIAESDDYADPAFLETLISLLEKTPGSSVAYSYSYLVDENGHILPEDWDRSHWTNYKVKIFEGKDFAKGGCYLIILYIIQVWGYSAKMHSRRSVNAIQNINIAGIGIFGTGCVWKVKL